MGSCSEAPPDTAQPGSKDTHVPACGVPRSPRLAIRTPSKTTQRLRPSDSIVHSGYCFLGISPSSYFGREA